MRGMAIPGWVIAVGVIVMAVLPVVIAEILRRSRKDRADLRGFEVLQKAEEEQR
jgi:hypothetical protein